MISHHVILICKVYTIMNIAIYNTIYPTYVAQEEIQSLYAYILLFEMLEIASPMSNELLNYFDLDAMTDKYVLMELQYIFKDDETAKKDIDEQFERIKVARKLKTIKAKDKQILDLINLTKSMMNDYRNVLKKCLETRLNNFRLTELAEFENENIWNLWLPFNSTPENKENEFIAAIVEMIKDKNFILATSEYVEDLYKHVDMNDVIPGNCDFIKVALLKFPIVCEMKFLQVKHTRDNLKAALEPFHKEFHECYDALFDLSFTEDNFEKISSIVQDKIVSLQKPLQQAIDKSLYITQLRNKMHGENVLTFNLGVTSVEKLVDYYQHAEMIEPYVATEIKNRLRREIDLEASCMFAFCNIKRPKNDEDRSIG